MWLAGGVAPQPTLHTLRAQWRVTPLSPVSSPLLFGGVAAGRRGAWEAPAYLYEIVQGQPTVQG